MRGPGVPELCAAEPAADTQEPDDAAWARTAFLWTGDVLVAESDRPAEDPLGAVYAYEPGTFRPLAVARRAGAGAGAAVYRYHLDHLGTPQELTAGDGRVAWRADLSVRGGSCTGTRSGWPAGRPRRAEPDHTGSGWSERMGAWDTGIFDNDDAMDWVVRLENNGPSAIAEALDAALGTAGYLERNLGASALAAAEVVAALRGRPGPALPPEVTAWVAEHPDEPGDDVAARAQGVVDRVVDPQTSEVAELWNDVEDGAAWRQGVANLRQRLVG